MATPSLATLRYLRLWDFGAKGECYLPSALYSQNSSNICLFVCFSILFEFVKNACIFVEKNRLVHYFDWIYLQNTVFCVFFAILGILWPVFNWNALPLAGVAHSKNNFFSISKRLNQILRGFLKNLSAF